MEWVSGWYVNGADFAGLEQLYAVAAIAIGVRRQDTSTMLALGPRGSGITQGQALLVVAKFHPTFPPVIPAGVGRGHTGRKPAHQDQQEWCKHAHGLL